ncbi:outer membrane beta-barrel protein [Marinobacter sp. M216]|uniref:Outer membrane beta-barrel protein n=1 Tax=Marinobacter albus TaxID=3030833 RepID=A0ABT7HDC0_9GAMM|nr:MULTISPECIES: outer membrane beta-barrel protein [unclassified Marinobacter]MBW7470250.1 outer membrane beta-barrel protein [Marinobacter sp. F4218]MDK9557485.1 outer membrane beta-barrel protein [Marinobacter sp. M216]
MKNVLICSALTAALASGYAHADNHSSNGSAISGQSLVENGYVEARLGFADVGLDDSAIVVAGTFGTSLAHVYPGLGAEADLTLTAVDAESNYFGGKVEASYASLAGYATYTYSLDKQIKDLEVLGRLGLAYTDAEASASNGSATASADDSSIDIAIGIGARYNLRDNLALVGRLDTYEDIDVFSVGATFRF